MACARAARRSSGSPRTRSSAPAPEPRATRALALFALLGMVNHTAQWYRPRGRLSATEIADGYVDLLLGA